MPDATTTTGGMTISGTSVNPASWSAATTSGLESISRGTTVVEGFSREEASKAVQDIKQSQAQPQQERRATLEQMQQGQLKTGDSSGLKTTLETIRTQAKTADEAQMAAALGIGAVSVPKDISEKYAAGQSFREKRAAQVEKGAKGTDVSYPTGVKSPLYSENLGVAEQKGGEVFIGGLGSYKFTPPTIATSAEQEKPPTMFQVGTREYRPSPMKPEQQIIQTEYPLFRGGVVGAGGKGVGVFSVPMTGIVTGTQTDRPPWDIGRQGAGGAPAKPIVTQTFLVSGEKLGVPDMTGTYEKSRTEAWKGYIEAQKQPKLEEPSRLSIVQRQSEDISGFISGGTTRFAEQYSRALMPYAKYLTGGEKLRTTGVEVVSKVAETFVAAPTKEFFVISQMGAAGASDIWRGTYRESEYAPVRLRAGEFVLTSGVFAGVLGGVAKVTPRGTAFALDALEQPKVILDVKPEAPPTGFIEQTGRAVVTTSKDYAIEAKLYGKGIDVIETGTISKTRTSVEAIGGRRYIDIGKITTNLPSLAKERVTMTTGFEPTVKADIGAREATVINRELGLGTTLKSSKIGEGIKFEMAGGMLVKTPTQDVFLGKAGVIEKGSLLFKLNERQVNIASREYAPPEAIKPQKVSRENIYPTPQTRTGAVIVSKFKEPGGFDLSGFDKTFKEPTPKFSTVREGKTREAQVLKYDIAAYDKPQQQAVSATVPKIEFATKDVIEARTGRFETFVLANQMKTDAKQLSGINIGQSIMGKVERVTVKKEQIREIEKTAIIPKMQEFDVARIKSGITPKLGILTAQLRPTPAPTPLSPPMTFIEKPPTETPPKKPPFEIPAGVFPDMSGGFEYGKKSKLGKGKYHPSFIATELGIKMPKGEAYKAERTGINIRGMIR